HRGNDGDNKKNQTPAQHNFSPRFLRLLFVALGNTGKPRRSIFCMQLRPIPMRRLSITSSHASGLSNKIQVALIAQGAFYMKILLSIALLALIPLVGAAPRTTAPQDAEVYFIAPQDGQTVTSPVTVKFGLKGMGVAPAGTQNAHTGHHHL